MLSVDNISFSYTNSETGEREAPVVNGLSFELRRGEALAVMGASGSGKTTLLRLLLGLIEPESGTIEGLAGKRISVVFQEDRLFTHMTARKNIEAVLGGRADRAERERRAALVSEVLAEVELTEAADKPIRELSGGMQRRVAIARALAFGGDILLLDEPLKGLDEELQKRVVPRIKKRFPTLLVITHSEEEAKLFGCERIIKL